MPERSRISRPAIKYAIAGDIGGTQLRAALVDAEGKLHARADCPTEPERGIAAAARRLVSLFREVSAGANGEEIAGIGLSSAGPIDPESGVYDHPPNLTGWHGRTMKPAITEAMGVPVTVGHDAHLAAIAETRFGAAIGRREVVYVTVSTGIGGGIIANGRPVNGAQGLAGEIGHLIIDPAGPKCNGGCSGCLEVFASGGGAAHEAQRRIAGGETSAILELASGDPDRITGQLVYEAAGVGDEMAKQIVERAVEALATGLANLLATFDPDVLIVGGSVLEGLAPYWDDLLGRVRRRGLLRYRDAVPIVTSALGDDVSILGAAAVAFDAARA